MLRRLTAILAMLALLGLLAMLVFAVHQHRRRSFLSEPAASVVNFARMPAVIS